MPDYVCKILCIRHISVVSLSLSLSLSLPESPTFIDETCFYHAGIIELFCRKQRSIELIGKNDLDDCSSHLLSGEWEPKPSFTFIT